MVINNINYLSNLYYIMKKLKEKFKICIQCNKSNLIDGVKFQKTNIIRHGGHVCKDCVLDKDNKAKPRIYITNIVDIRSLSSSNNKSSIISTYF